MVLAVCLVVVYSTGGISSALLSFAGIFVVTDLEFDSEPLVLPAAAGAALKHQRAPLVGGEDLRFLLSQ